MGRLPSPGDRRCCVGPLDTGVASGALLGGGGGGCAPLAPTGGGRLGDGVVGLLRPAILCGGCGGPERKLSELFTAWPLLGDTPSCSKLGLLTCGGGGGTLFLCWAALFHCGDGGGGTAVLCGAGGALFHCAGGGGGPLFLCCDILFRCCDGGGGGPLLRCCDGGGGGGKLFLCWEGGGGTLFRAVLFCCVGVLLVFTGGHFFPGGFDATPPARGGGGAAAPLLPPSGHKRHE